MTSSSRRVKKSILFGWRWLAIIAVRLTQAGSAISHWATVIAAIVALFTFVYGYRQFRETQQMTRQTLNLQREGLELDREAKAIELFIKYNDVMVQPRSSRKRGKGDSTFWRENLAIGIAESIFKLRGEDKSWHETVRWMISDHEEFFNENGLDCATYDEGFISLVNDEMKHSVCVPPG